MELKMKNKHKVKVFTTNTCPYCDMTKDFLKEHNIKFEEANVQEDREAAKEMIEKSHQMGVPVILVDDEVIVGFNVPALKSALDLD